MLPASLVLASLVLFLVQLVLLLASLVHKSGTSLSVVELIFVILAVESFIGGITVVDSESFVWTVAALLFKSLLDESSDDVESWLLLKIVSNMRPTIDEKFNKKKEKNGESESKVSTDKSYGD